MDDLLFCLIVLIIITIMAVAMEFITNFFNKIYNGKERNDFQDS